MDAIAGTLAPAERTPRRRHSVREDGFAKLHSLRPKWAVFTTVEDLRENIVEYQLLEVARDLGLLSKAAAKALLGLLSKRNECAHPSGYSPSLNESLLDFYRSVQHRGWCGIDREVDGWRRGAGLG